jgi:uncharacterized protein (TIGR04222 family)
MNPFDLPGPEFLLFYFVLAVAALLLQRYYVRRNELAGTTEPHSLTDPYQIAYLRGGKDEALRVAVVSLADRGLLKAEADGVARASKRAAESVRRPIEKAIILYFSTEGEKAISVFEFFEPEPDSLLEYRRDCVQRGFMPSARAILARAYVLTGVLAVLIGSSVIKIMVATVRGHHNIGLLVVLTVVAVALAWRTYHRPRTANGDLAVAALKEEYSSLRQRAQTIRAGGATNEAAVLAAVFGLSALSEDAFPFVKDLFPKASSSTGWSSGCGGGGCGGGGGGGGCGGGCGGCGG